jgi:alkanesulfonate monooxygenase SsuD/methylene tetrahydromethanopterin reductase-like flavin-dependent oxidoreductase (luciferase family)
MVSNWWATIPGTDGVKWTKKRIAQELSVGGPGARAIGSPKTVADILQTWADEAGIDGFNISYAINPSDFEAVIEWLLPELRARGVFGKTTRPRLRGRTTSEMGLDQGWETII